MLSHLFFPSPARIAALFLTLLPLFAARLSAQTDCPSCEVGTTVLSDYTYVATTRQVDAGPFTYTVSFTNTRDEAIDFIISCSTSSPQLTCTTPSPSSGFIAPQGTVVVTVGFTTKGVGTFTQTITATDGDEVQPAYTTNPGIVVTGSPIAMHFFPIDSAHFGSADTLQAYLYNSSGINTTTSKILVDGQVKTSVFTSLGGNSYKLTATNLTLAGGYHTWQTYGCATSGRCDTTATTFIQDGPPTVFSLDDSLPPPVGAPSLSYILPGALNPPPGNLRGCPVGSDDPEIRLVQPFSYTTQPGSGAAPGGLIFMAGVKSPYDPLMHIMVDHVDHVPSQGITCASFHYLARSEYDWTYWHNASPTDVLWDSYPYGDLSLLDEPPEFEYAMLGDLPGTFHHGPHVANGEHLPRLFQARLFRPMRLWFSRRQSSTPLLPDPGAIKPSTYTVSLNGNVIISGGNGVDGNVVKLSLERFGSDFTIPVTDSRVNTYDALHPTANNGGWNEMIATISDSTQHTTSVRARFVVIPRGPMLPVALTRLRDLTQESEDNCAAFGVFQCGSAYLTQTIPGYVSRDKDRSLHLVYRSASQKLPTAIPVQMYVDRLQAAPDSIWVRVQVSGANIGDTLRYAGTQGIISGWGVNHLDEDGSETRVLGGELRAATSPSPVVRSAMLVLKQFYDVLGSREDTISQNVVTYHLTDTTMTRLGSGWAFAEQSRLFFGQTMNGNQAAIWLSGDGSYLVFQKISTVWTSPAGQTMKLVDISGAPENSAYYVISFPTGSRLGFLQSGYQAWAADIIGNKTTYTYNTNGTRLIRIADPTGAGFRIQYNNSGGNLGQVKEIYAQGPGQTDSTKMATLTYDASKRLQRVDIWRSGSAFDSTAFGYLNTTSGAFLTTITDPRSTTSAPIASTLTYDTVTWTPVQVQRPGAHSSTGAVASFRDYWRRAVPRAGYARKFAGQGLERLVYPQQLRGTSIPFEGLPTDFTADKFGGPTWVRLVVPEPPITFPPTASGGDVVRFIERDTLGRVLRIVRSRDSVTSADSVMYQYDALSRVTKMIRNTAAYPVGSNSLDTVSYSYDSVTVGTAVTSGGTWCSRMLTMQGVLGATDLTTTVYGASGVAKCLPQKIIGAVPDTTIFTYGSLALGNSAATRPVSIRDPNNLTTSATYHSTSWNTQTVTAPGGPVTTYFYSNPLSLGRPDSIADPVNIRTRFIYDRIGRVLYSKTGTGSLSPVARSIYGPGVLVTESQVYASTVEDMTTASGTVQSTKTFYDRLGQVDSLLGPGSRSPTKVGRKQSFSSYTFGSPVYSYSGNGTFIGRILDGQGRPKLTYQSTVDPTRSFDNEPFADAVTTTFYNGLVLGVGPNLSAGQAYSYQYDNKGELVGDFGYDVYMRDTLGSHRRAFSRVGALIADTVKFSGGIRIVRRYEYNRRGQRTVAADTVTLLGPGSLTGERKGRIDYTYDATTGRLTQVVATVDSGAGLTYAKIKWFYDRGGRDTLRMIWLNPLAGAGAGDTILTRTTYDGFGRVSYTRSLRGKTSKLWYEFGSPSYTAVNELTSFNTAEKGVAGTWTNTNTYSTDGTRRLLTSTRSQLGASTGYTWKYDVFGNRVYENRSSTIYTAEGMSGCNSIRDTLIYSADDNRLKTRRKAVGCIDYSTYFTDQAGNRIAQRDTLNGGSTLRTQKLTYTAANQLYYSLTATEALALYDANWHWYDASGMRIMTHAQVTNTWSPTFQPDSGFRTFYYYDGSDVALTVVRGNANNYWVGQRYLTGGIDAQLAGRFTNTGGAPKSLVLVGGQNGTSVVNVKADGTEDLGSTVITRGPFGTLEGGGSMPTTNAQTGFAGASTPDQTGGFVYLRNRWYDPKTGRFLTQDPIGLAGGVNLYAYAGNNPIAFNDPFGLDTLKVISQRAERTVAAMRASKQHAPLLKEADAAAAHFLVLGTDVLKQYGDDTHMDPTYGGEAFQLTKGKITDELHQPPSTMRVYQDTRWDGIALVNPAFGAGNPGMVASAISHEIGAHLMGIEDRGRIYVHPWASYAQKADARVFKQYPVVQYHR